MKDGYGWARCRVDCCDGVGAIPIELVSRLHVLLCTLHSREWRAQHVPTCIRTAEAHQRWRAWLKEASHRAWLLQTSQRRQLEQALAQRRAELRRAELRKFRGEVESLKASMERTVTATRPGSAGARALRKMANALRQAVFGNPGGLESALPHRG
jgi:hypothetical protein